MKSLTLDDLDRKIIHALFLDGRVPFRRLAQVFDVSEQTIARRYRLMHESGTVRVVGQLNSQRLGQSDWAVRVRCTPDATTAIATALAQRPDTAWVQLISGGTEIFCTVRAHDDRRRTALLLEELPSSRHIVNLEAYYLLHLFISRTPAVASVLSAAEVAELERPWPQPADRGGSKLRDQDWALIQALAEDGRETYQRLASQTHWHHSSVRRRIEELLDDGVLYFDVDFDARALGIGAGAILWLWVVPAKLMAVGQALAQHAEIPFAAATSGASNLMASVACQDDYALFDYLTQKIAALDGVTRLETAPVIRYLKQHGALRHSA